MHENIIVELYGLPGLYSSVPIRNRAAGSGLLLTCPCHTRITAYHISHTATLGTLPFTTPGASIRTPSNPLPTTACARFTPKKAISMGSRTIPSQLLAAGKEMAHNVNQLQASIAVGHQ